MRSSWGCLAALVVVGCNNAPAPAKAAGAPPATNAAQRAPGATAAIKGTVAEKVDSGGYSYLRLTTDAGEIWAAVPQAATTVGAVVGITHVMPMDGFESKTLNRKFDKIVFGTLATDGAEPAAAWAHPAMGAAAAAGGADAAAGYPAPSAAPVDTTPIKVERAAGAEGRTVAEVWAAKATLKDATVLVRGKVVKVNSGIFGHTWIHVRDGSGTAAAKDDDLTITTTGAAPALGDVVLARGALHLDRDFGAGYAYAAIIEDATVTK